jgi:hypothetical protein
VGWQSRPSSRATPLIEEWQGGIWRSLTIGSNANGQLRAISCQRLLCMAVGMTRNGTYILRWGGGRWQVARSVSVLGKGALSGVACTTSEACVAVGGVGRSLASRTLTEVSRGGRWRRIPSPNP